MQHEVDQKLKTAKHIYDADISQNMPLRNLLCAEMFGSNKMLFRCGSKQ
jgi:hypothetical protein